MMNTKKQEQMKIAAILYDLGLDMELIEAMTSLTHEELTKFYQ